MLSILSLITLSFAAHALKTARNTQMSTPILYSIIFRTLWRLAWQGERWVCRFLMKLLVEFCL
jgi:hypothetical protein